MSYTAIGDARAVHAALQQSGMFVWPTLAEDRSWHPWRYPPAEPVSGFDVDEPIDWAKIVGVGFVLAYAIALSVYEKRTREAP